MTRTRRERLADEMWERIDEQFGRGVKRHWWDYEPPQYVRRAVETALYIFAATMGGYLAGYLVGSGIW